MADEIKKKIKIEVELESEKLQKSITSLNKLIDSLIAKQQQLNIAGMQNSATFDNISSKLEIFQKRLKDVNTQLQANSTSLNALGTANKALEGLLTSATDKQEKHAKAIADDSVKVKDLTTQLTTLSQAVNQQSTSTDKSKSSLEEYAGTAATGIANVQQLQKAIGETTNTLKEQGSAVAENKEKFDAHKLTMDHLKKSFDEIKNISGVFGPSLKEAAEGFDVMKKGLKLVQDGFKGVGAAIKADGFEFLLEILQMMFDYFVKSSEGSKILKGAISAIGVVVKDITDFFHSLMDGIINAFSHPVESIQALGRIIKENIINRFQAFGVILDGIIHLDFKKMADGAIQAFTGVTNATDKVVNGFHSTVKAVEKTAGEMVDAYKKGYKEVEKHVETHESKVVASLQKQIEKYKELLAAEKRAHQGQANSDIEDENSDVQPGRREQITEARGSNVSDIKIAPVKTPDSLPNITLKNEQATANTTVEIKRTALQKIEDYAKKSGLKIATDALKTLNNSIKKQADAKVAALEKDKAAELSNTSLTSAQKLAIENKYKKQEAAVKIKAFKDEQKASIAQALINGALAMTKTAANTGFPLTFAFEPLVVAQTAVEVAKIASQKAPAYAWGGLHYSSDGRGGVLPGYSRTDNTNAYLRSGEAVVVSEAMQVPWARNLVSAINVGFGGRDFSITNPGRGYAVGGIFTDGGDANRYYNQPVNDQKNLANTIAYQMINNFPPVYVDVKDVNNQQNILAQTINRVNL